MGWRWGAVLLICAVAAAAGTFALVRATSHPANAQDPGKGPATDLTLARPLPPSARQVSLSDAASALGGPIVLPSSGQVTPADVGAVWLNQLPDNTTSPAVAVTFPAQGLVVEYTRPALTDPLTNYRGKRASLLARKLST